MCISSSNVWDAKASYVAPTTKTNEATACTRPMCWIYWSNRAIEQKQHQQMKQQQQHRKNRVFYAEGRFREPNNGGTLLSASHTARTHIQAPLICLLDLHRTRTQEVGQLIQTRSSCSFSAGSWDTRKMSQTLSLSHRHTHSGVSLASLEN